MKIGHLEDETKLKKHRTTVQSSILISEIHDICIVPFSLRNAQPSIHSLINWPLDFQINFILATSLSAKYAVGFYSNDLRLTSCLPLSSAH